jgi:hypothetical protein
MMEREVWLWPDIIHGSPRGEASGVREILQPATTGYGAVAAIGLARHTPLPLTSAGLQLRVLEGGRASTLTLPRMTQKRTVRAALELIHA